MADFFVACALQQIFGSLGEFLVEVPGKRGARVISEDADEHEGVVLEIGPCDEVFLQIVAYHVGALLGCTGRGFGGFDDGRQVDDLVFGIVGAVRFAKESLVGDSQVRVFVGRHPAHETHVAEKSSRGQTRTHHTAAGDGFGAIIVGTD